jgi:hypothetical protein
MPSNPVLISRSAYARSVKNHGRESPQAHDARRELYVARIEREIQRTIADVAPLTDEQTRRITNLLAGA